VGVGDGQSKKSNRNGDEDEIRHALVSRGFDTKPWALRERSRGLIKMS
jgi:hypothetical protein